MSSPPLDLVVLVADLDQEQAIRSLLRDRVRSLGIRSVKSEYLRHVRHDPGCLNEAEAILQPYQMRAAHALVLLDLEGSGREDQRAEDIESELTSRLGTSGWGDRATAVVIDPELEIWVWSDSPQVEEVLGWTGRKPALREWLQARGLLIPTEPKPRDPKLALREALHEVRQKPSAAIFGRLAQGVGLDRCADASFQRLRKCLWNWFAEDASAG